jgi:DNA-directed RNA polymerase alpha subunit
MIDQIERDRIERYLRDEKIVAARQAGDSFKEIGQQFCISPGNARDRIDRYFRRQKVVQSTDPFERLTIRTQRLLQANGITTVALVTEKFRSGTLLTIRNFGHKSLHEIRVNFSL